MKLMQTNRRLAVALPFQALLQSDSQKERLQIFEKLLLEEKERLEAHVQPLSPLEALQGSKL